MAQSNKNLGGIYSRIIIGMILACLQLHLKAQGCSGINIQWRADIVSTCQQPVMTMMHDVLDRPYLYVANKEGGLKIYDISTTTAPVLTGTVPLSSIGNLDVMNLTQEGNFVYLALGNHFNNNQSSGMAIIDITIPSAPIVKKLLDASGLPGRRRHC